MTTGHYFALPPPRAVIKSLSQIEALKEMFRPTDFSYQGYCFSKLYRTSVISANGLRFNEAISFNEDRLFVVNFIFHSKKHIAYTTHCVYRYLLRDGSAMGSLSKGYNKKFATDFDAFVQMYQLIKTCTDDRQLLRFVKEGMCWSYKTNHKMMASANVYDSAIHRHMTKALIKNGVIFSYLKQELRTFIGNLALLICPGFVIRYKRGG